MVEGSTTVNHNGADMSKDEAEVYDRQIRLWGLEAQNKLRQSDVLLVGLSGLGSEVVKNIMLSGLNSITLMDEKNVTEDDVLANFLLAPGSVGSNRAASSAAKAKSLNPMVSFNVEEASIESKSEEDIKQFSLVILIDQEYDVIKKWDNICRKFNIRFCAGSVFGWSGFAFMDFNNHSFLMKQAKQQTAVMDLDGPVAVDATTIEDDVFLKETLTYPSFDEAMNVNWTSKKLILKTKRLVPSSYIPIRAILRAQQEKVLTGDEDKDAQIVKEYWTKELNNVNRKLEDDQKIYGEDGFEYLVGPQLSAVCAIVGGLLAQEAIKALSENEHPLRNLFLYSALDTTGIVAHFPPK